MALSEGLAVNPTLRMLSLTYCCIGPEGAEAIFEILIYTKSALEEVNLSGNVLKNDGVVKVLQGVSIAKNLKKILLADNQFSDEEKVMMALEFCMTKNDKLGRYDLKFNNIGEQGKSSRAMDRRNSYEIFEFKLARYNFMKRADPLFYLNRLD